ncbi:hypothetical protein FBZ89_10116 [Nitrospirillum amazonense]|uniref:Secreted protein n=1 Tax=Nitrospirillum amazonense TaxID=28077 RepID=A0A560FS31_9PROT|nr:hypothetical protein [Nitrospirillum amazonense]TWB24391.1 hypothetical protein FBZ89_10116 [Nitrospirillum amazonense]
MNFPSATRRHFLAATAAAGALGTLPGAVRAATGDAVIRPFKVQIPDEALAEMKRRVNATICPCSSPRSTGWTSTSSM